jgi:hypothetical protein
MLLLSFQPGAQPMPVHRVAVGADESMLPWLLVRCLAPAGARHVFTATQAMTREIYMFNPIGATVFLEPLGIDAALPGAQAEPLRRYRSAGFLEYE